MNSRRDERRGIEGGRGERDLGLVGEADDEARDGEGGLVDEGVVDAFVAEIAGEHASVSGETSDGDTDVVVDLEDLALVGREVRGGLVDGGENDVGGGAEADGGSPLLDGLHGVFYLEQTPRRAPRRHVGVILVPKHLFSVSSSPLPFVVIVLSDGTSQIHSIITLVVPSGLLLAAGVEGLLPPQVKARGWSGPARIRFLY